MLDAMNSLERVLRIGAVLHERHHRERGFGQDFTVLFQQQEELVVSRKKSVEQILQRHGGSASRFVYATQLRILYEPRPILNKKADARNDGWLIDHIPMNVT
jgi:hypothetical protein